MSPGTETPTSTSTSHTGASTPITSHDVDEHADVPKASLSDRMRQLATAEHAAIVPVTSTTRTSLSHTEHTTTRTSVSASDPLDALLAELQMSDAVPRFRAEGVHYAGE